MRSAHTPARRRSPWPFAPIAFLTVLLAAAGTTACGSDSNDDSSPPAEATPAEGIDVRLFVHDGVAHRYAVDVPPRYDGSAPVPMVFYFHGGGGSIRNGLGRFDVRAAAEQAGWLLVIPEGYSPRSLLGQDYSWNAVHCCNPALARNVDDPGFVRHLIESLSSEFNVDPTRIYAMGFSNGGMLTHRLASELSDLLAAAVVSEGTIGGQAKNAPEPAQITPPSRPVPVMMYHGAKDRNVRPEGGLTGNLKNAGRYDMSLEESASFWADADGCDPEPETAGESWGTLFTFSGCDAGSEVVVLLMDELDHSWPYEGNSGVRGADEAIRFLGRHSLQ